MSSWFGTGRTVLDRYVLVRQIGQGGVSLIYEAVDMERMRPAAVKVLAPAFAQSERACRAARQEPLLMQRMSHPTVPKIYGFGDAPLRGYQAGHRVPCVAMELLNGVSLADRLTTGALPWRQAVEIAASIAELLAVAHRRGIAHRDLTAENIMLTTDGVKIIDFGLAVTFRSAVTSRPAVTFRSAAVLRPVIDPIRPALAEPQAWDVYALGVLLYRMLTGRSPHPVGVRMLRPAPTPVLLTPGVPRSLAELCRQCMAKRPADRPGSGTVALSLWAEFAAHRDH